MFFAQTGAAGYWLQIAERFGFPAAILLLVFVFFGFVTWRIGVWLAPRADKVITAHVALVNTLSQNSVTQTADLGELRRHLEKVSENQNRCAENLEKLSSATAKLVGAAQATAASVKATGESIKVAAEQTAAAVAQAASPKDAAP